MLSIHQSQFMPWLPYFYKIAASNLFIIMDDVQFQKNGVQNRNQIKTSNGVLWLTVPVKHDFGQKINEVEIAAGYAVDKLLSTIELNYKKAEYFNDIFPDLVSILTNKSDNRLFTLNDKLLKYFLRILNIKTPIKYSSEFMTQSAKGDMVLELVTKSNDLHYLSGGGGLAYMSLDVFNDNGIIISECGFSYSEYKQLWSKHGFIPNLSVLDLLFNNKCNALSYINNNGTHTLVSV